MPSHLDGFTPVCSTEIMMFASLTGEFKAMGTRLIVLSVNALCARIAEPETIHVLEWNGKRHAKVKFPRIENIRMELANMYGMIQPDQSKTQAERAEYIIDPAGKVRTIFYCPLPIGRNSDGLRRLAQGL